SKIIDSMLVMQKALKRGAAEKQVLEDLLNYLPCLTAFLRALSFLSCYRIMTRSGDRMEEWMGLRRLRRESTTKIQREQRELSDLCVFVVDSEGRAVLSLWPLVQAAEPLPG